MIALLKIDRSQPYQNLARNAVLEQPDEGLRRLLQTIRDIELDTSYTAVDEDDEIDIRFEGYAEEAGVTGRFYLKGQPPTSGDWVLWKEFSVPQTSDANVFSRCIPAIRLAGPGIWDFVDGNGRIDLRIEMTRIAAGSGSTVTSHYDYVQLIVVDH